MWFSLHITCGNESPGVPGALDIWPKLTKIFITFQGQIFFAKRGGTNSTLLCFTTTRQYCSRYCLTVCKQKLKLCDKQLRGCSSLTHLFVSVTLSDLHILLTKFALSRDS